MATRCTTPCGVDGGVLDVQGDFRLAQDPGSQTHLQLVSGELQITGQFETGAGHSRLEMRGGTLRLGAASGSPEPAEERRRLQIDDLEWHGGRLEGVTSIEGQFHHQDGVFSIDQRETPFTISGDYRMQESAVIQLPLAGGDRSKETLFQIEGAAALQGTLVISSHAPDDFDINSLAAGEHRPSPSSPPVGLRTIFAGAME